MIHSNVKMLRNTYGILDLVFFILIICVFFLVPVAKTTVNGEVTESFTVFSKLGRNENIAPLIIPVLFFVLFPIIGVLKISLQKVFSQFVVEVIHFYAMLSGFLGFMAGTSVMAQSVQSSTSFLGYEVSQSLGLCFPILVALFFIGFIYSIEQYCSFYRWYPLQTLFWVLHPIVCPLITIILGFFVTLLFPNAQEAYVTVFGIIGWVVLGVELWLVLAYRKSWNSKLRASWARSHPKEAAEMLGVSFDSESQQTSPAEHVTEVLQTEVKQEVHEETASGVNGHPELVLQSSQKRNGRLYIGIGVAVIIIASFLFFLFGVEKEEEKELVNIPAIWQTAYEGVVANAEVQMVLAEKGDSLIGSYFYKKVKQPIQLKGVKNGFNYRMDEFVDGKHTGTFTLEWGEYDDLGFLNGTWSNGKKKVKAYLNERIRRICPSPDPNHPFVGEWITSGDAKEMAYVKLGLYNKDIYGEYASISMMVNGNYQVVSVDSVLKLEATDAVLQVKNGSGERQEFKLHYAVSDSSLLVETEKWGTYHLLLENRDLIDRINELDKLKETMPQEPPQVAELLELVDEESAEAPELLEYIEAEEEAEEETDEMAEEKARLRAELEAELQKEQQDNAANDNKIYDGVETMPEYPGGVSAMMSFIGKNLVYPEVSQENGIQGRVVVQFVINVDGTVSDIKVVKSVDPYLDKEAIRVVGSMPKWKPGTQEGKPVRVKYTVPINFRLQ